MVAIFGKDLLQKTSRSFQEAQHFGVFGGGFRLKMGRLLLQTLVPGFVAFFPK